MHAGVVLEVLHGWPELGLPAEAALGNLQEERAGVCRRRQRTGAADWLASLAGFQFRWVFITVTYASCVGDGADTARMRHGCTCALRAAFAQRLANG